MPGYIALFVCITVIVYLFKTDFNKNPKMSLSLWIPCFWFSILLSRPISMWIGLTAHDNLLSEGSPFDRTIFTMLILIGLIILLQRKIDWKFIVKNNASIFSFVLYLGISTLWADNSFVSFKRWVKEIGNLIMIFVILTEPEPIEALKAIIRRSAYVLIPLSVVFIKYYPAGRIYTVGGQQMLTGVTTHKNDLGILCLICGLFFVWNIFEIRFAWSKNKRKNELMINIIFLLMIMWLLFIANSATSLVCFIIGVCLLISLRKIKNSIRKLRMYCILTVIFLLILYKVFDLSTVLLTTLGRDETLTGRTEIWEQTIDLNTDPWIGAGYESFWMSNKTQEYFERMSFRLNQAHNGYLEIYLNSGYVGLILLMGVIYSSYRNINKKLMLQYDFEYQSFCMTFLILTLIFNITETAFKGLSPMWFLFILITVEMQSSSARMK
jgi:exopolysaccharide production protein ExoQ